MTLAIVGVVAPPAGGVATATANLAAAARERGIHVGTLDTSRPRARALADLLRARSVIINISGPRTLSIFALLGSIRTGVAIPYFHGGGVIQLLERLGPIRRRLVRRALRRCLQAWATGEHIASKVEGYGARCRLVAPIRDQAGGGGTIREDRSGYAVLLGGDPEVYGVSRAVEAVEIVRESHDPEARLTIVAYGDGVRHLSDYPRWVSMEVDVPQTRLLEILAGIRALLRPTTTDGDSVVVREALALGCRVIASDVVPRPKGVELCENDARSLALAIRNGGEPSLGDGLGMPVDAAIGDLCLQLGQ